jgi:hypothetical protein
MLPKGCTLMHRAAHCFRIHVIVHGGPSTPDTLQGDQDTAKPWSAVSFAKPSIDVTYFAQICISQCCHIGAWTFKIIASVQPGEGGNSRARVLVPPLSDRSNDHRLPCLDPGVQWQDTAYVREMNLDTSLHNNVSRSATGEPTQGRAYQKHCPEHG